jgi:tRNA G18 (ribose-2'-O)-methylase SpoU
MNLIEIDNPRDPRIAHYASMRDDELAQRSDPRDARAHGGRFIAEGELVVGRLLSSRFTAESLLTTRARLDTLVAHGSLTALTPETAIYLCSRELLNEIVGFNMHRGLLAIGVRFADHGAGVSLDDLAVSPGPLVVLEDINNHDNVGGIFRNIAALGGSGAGALLSPRTVDPLYRKSLRVSMGSVLSVPFARAQGDDHELAGGLHGALSHLAAHGWRTLAMTPRSNALALSIAANQARRDGQRIALIMGAEGPGLSPRALSACSDTVTIPMNPVGAGVDSLNVAQAVGIGLYEISRT